MGFSSYVGPKREYSSLYRREKTETVSLYIYLNKDGELDVMILTQRGFWAGINELITVSTMDHSFEITKIDKISEDYFPEGKIINGYYE